MIDLAILNFKSQNYLPFHLFKFDITVKLSLPYLNNTIQNRFEKVPNSLLFIHK